MKLQDARRIADGRAAVIDAATGVAWGFDRLCETSGRWANHLRAAGVAPSDKVAVLAPNKIEAFGAYWAALRTGARFVPVNWNLRAAEAKYILDDSGAQVILAHGAFADLAQEIAGETDIARISFGGRIPGFESLEGAAFTQPFAPTSDECEGGPMFYSSGTTGRPKGIVHPSVGVLPYGEMPAGAGVIAGIYELDGRTVYLCPAPLYHAAPLMWSMTVMRLGGTVVLMDRFDPAAALEAVSRYRVTHAQFVPTHFVRMLKLNDAQRRQHDLSSLKRVIHAAAPCPPDVKHAMISWLGPIIDEFYAGSEGAGMTAISSQEWLKKPGSVGQPAHGRVHILRENEEPCAAGEIGQIFFEGGASFTYQNDDEKTAQAKTANGYATFGDYGWLDEDGYLFLADRRQNLIISGGVNIYPRESEDQLILHPDVEDVAVVGAPDSDLGQVVVAFIAVRSGVTADDALANRLLAFCRERLSAYKCPRRVMFVDAIPRLESGKLLKRELPV